MTMSATAPDDEAATVDITTAAAAAVKVPARDVRVGDSVFSTTGQPDKVIRVASPDTNRRRTTVRITPKNLWPLVVDPDDTVTILRGNR